MKKIEFYKAMLPAGTFEKCTGYQFCAGRHECVVHKTKYDGWIVTHIGTGLRVTPGGKEAATRAAAIDLITKDPAIIAALDRGTCTDLAKAAGIRLMEYKEKINHVSI